MSLEIEPGIILGIVYFVQRNSTNYANNKMYREWVADNGNYYYIKLLFYSQNIITYVKGYLVIH